MLALSIIVSGLLRLPQPSTTSNPQGDVNFDSVFKGNLLQRWSWLTNTSLMAHGWRILSPLVRITSWVRNNRSDPSDIGTIFPFVLWKWHSGGVRKMNPLVKKQILIIIFIKMILTDLRYWLRLVKVLWTVKAETGRRVIWKYDIGYVGCVVWECQGWVHSQYYIDHTISKIDYMEYYNKLNVTQEYKTGIGC